MLAAVVSQLEVPRSLAQKCLVNDACIDESLKDTVYRNLVRGVFAEFVGNMMLGYRGFGTKQYAQYGLALFGHTQLRTG